MDLKNPFISFFNRFVLIKVYLLNLLGQFVIDIDDPVGSHPGVPSIGLLENILLCHFSHSVVIEFSPFVIESIFNKSIVVTTWSISIMDTDSLQVIWVLVKTSIGFLSLLLDLLQLLLHFICLSSDLISIFVEHVNSLLDLCGVLLLNGTLIEGWEELYVFGILLHCNISLTLLGKEQRGQFEDLLQVHIFFTVELLILTDTVLQLPDLVS